MMQQLLTGNCCIILYFTASYFEYAQINNFIANALMS